MSLYSPALMIDGVTPMAMSAAILTLFGASRRVYRGFGWWVGAQWLGTLGLWLHNLTASHPSLLPLANLLLLQWPIVVLGGVRRFYPRRAIEIAPQTDWLLLATIFVIWLASWTVHGGKTSGIVVLGLGACILYLYSAILTVKLLDVLRNSVLTLLFVVQCLAGLVHALGASQTMGPPLRWISVDDLHLADAWLTTTTALLMVYLCMQLTYERTLLRLRESQRQLQYLADMDPLTEVPNRRHFFELAGRMLASSASGGAAIVMFDVDHFKRVNDERGHAAGDTALRAVASCVRDTMRGRDVVGRIGGDEFALLLPETPEQDAVAVAERIAAKLQAHASSNHSVTLSLSFGVVLALRNEGIDDAMRRADRALYEAKRLGRNCAVIAGGTDDELVFGRSQTMGLRTYS